MRSTKCGLKCLLTHAGCFLDDWSREQRVKGRSKDVRLNVCVCVTVAKKKEEEEEEEAEEEEGEETD